MSHGCGVVSAGFGTTDAEVAGDVERLARYFADSGQVVPGITLTQSGRARSWWWPMPAARDRSAIASLCSDASVAVQRAVAEGLATEVDRVVRQRLGDDRIELIVRRPGRRSIEEAWLISLNTPDPWLARSHDVDKLRAFEREIAS